MKAVILLPIFILYANLETLKVRTSPRSFIFIIKRIGPSTPPVTLKHSEVLICNLHPSNTEIPVFCSVGDDSCHMTPLYCVSSSSLHLAHLNSIKRVLDQSWSLSRSLCRLLRSWTFISLMNFLSSRDMFR